jgi:hypothetical protein
MKVLASFTSLKRKRGTNLPSLALQAGEAALAPHLFRTLSALAQLAERFAHALFGLAGLSLPFALPALKPLQRGQKP